MIKLLTATKSHWNKGGKNMPVNLSSKKPLKANQVSKALNRTSKAKKPNLQVVTLEDGTKIRLTAREKRTLMKDQKVA